MHMLDNKGITSTLQKNVILLEITCQSMHIILCSKPLWLANSIQPVTPSLMQS